MKINWKKVFQAIKKDKDERCSVKFDCSDGDVTTLPVIDLSNLSEGEKYRLIRDFAEPAAGTAMQLFVSLGLKTHFEIEVIDENSGDSYKLNFKKA